MIIRKKRTEEELYRALEDLVNSEPINEPVSFTEIATAEKYSAIREDCPDLLYVPFHRLKQEIDKVGYFNEEDFSLLDCLRFSTDYETQLTLLCMDLKECVLDVLRNPEERRRMEYPAETFMALSSIEDKLTKYNKASSLENAKECVNTILENISTDLYSFKKLVNKSEVTIRSIEKYFNQIIRSKINTLFFATGKKGGFADIEDIDNLKLSSFGTIYFLPTFDGIEDFMEAYLEENMPQFVQKVTEILPYHFSIKEPEIHVNLKEDITIALGSVLLGKEYVPIPSIKISLKSYQFEKIYTIAQAAYSGELLFIREKNGLRYTYDLEEILRDNEGFPLPFGDPDFQDFELMQEWNNELNENLITVKHKPTGYMLRVTRSLEQAIQCSEKYEGRLKAEKQALKGKDPSYLLAQDLVKKHCKKAEEYAKWGYSFLKSTEEEIGKADTIAKEQGIDTQEYIKPVLQAIFASTKESINGGYGHFSIAEEKIALGNRIAKKQNIDITFHIQKVIKKIFAEGTERDNDSIAMAYFKLGINIGWKYKVNIEEEAGSNIETLLKQGREYYTGGYFHLANGKFETARYIANYLNMQVYIDQITTLQINLKKWEK